MKNQQTKKMKKTVLGILGLSLMTVGLGLGMNSTVFATFRKTELVDRNIVLSGIVKENVKQDSEKEVSRDSGAENSKNTVGDENSDDKNSDSKILEKVISEGEVLEGEVPEGELETADEDEGELDEKEISEVPVLGQVGQTLKDFWWILAILGGLISFLLVFLFIKKKGKRNIHHLQ